MNRERVIILEGPDECGKTTLAFNLAQFFHSSVFHSTATKALFQALPDYHKNIMDNVRDNLLIGNSIVLDRFWPSEIAYGKLFRPASNYGDVADYLHNEIKKLNYLYIFCMSPSAWGRYKKGHVDPAHTLSFEDYTKVWLNYVELYNGMVAHSEKAILYVLDTEGTHEPVKHAEFMNLVYELTK